MFRDVHCVNQSGCFPAKWVFSGEVSREKVFGTNHIRRFGPLASSSHESSRELFIMLINDMYLEYGLDNLVRYLSYIIFYVLK
jgi:hypothetical protein